MWHARESDNSPTTFNVHCDRPGFRPLQGVDRSDVPLFRNVLLLHVLWLLGALFFDGSSGQNTGAGSTTVHPPGMYLRHPECPVHVQYAPPPQDQLSRQLVADDIGPEYYQATQTARTDQVFTLFAENLRWRCD